ncbi:oxidoreductase [Thermosipho ferrireducens]|uniref:Oxidoreductase n=1 Tax=Thermosipho ferrireducens TaxID=2571116 RepID=A0ABX7S9K7_9BACT|nr:proton-conducting transporter membrane subunit [Thermosipho ferrireducens]QTA38058.1 oxidoreductase [Thermosipho ferrireducens]
MISLTTLIITLLFSTIISYFLTRINKKIGTIFNFALISYSLYIVSNLKTGIQIKLFSITPGLENTLIVTELGKYFAIISFIVLSMVAFFNITWINKKVNFSAAFNAFYLFTSAGSLGVFFAKDMLTLYIFWEMAVLGSLLIVPMGREDAKKAAITYLAISSTGSYLYLYAALSLWNKYGTLTFDKIAYHLINESSVTYKWLIISFIVAAGIAKSGIFPLHTWLRTTLGKAPDTFSAVMSGQLEKLGAYIIVFALAVIPSLQLFRPIYSSVPSINYLLIILGNISIILGTFMAIRQNDMKMLMAYSSIANGGYILVGIATIDTIGFSGGLFHVFNHAIASAMIFLSFAAVIYRTNTSKIDEMGGLIWRMPLTFVTYLVGIISLAGIPPTSGFISKWMIFNVLVRKGMFVTAAIAFIGSVGSFLYVFRPLAGVFLGQLKKKHYDVKEVPVVMLIPMILLVFLTLFAGIIPGPILDKISAIETELGITPIEHTATIIKTPLGQWDTLTVFTMFTTGFIIAFILFVIFPKGKKVELTDQYTGAEFLHNYDLYHYATGFYRFIERLYDKHPSFEKLYGMLANFFKNVGEFVNAWVYKTSPGAYVFWVSVVILILFWVRW